MTDIVTKRKRLYYQSQHRGMREMDLVLGGFAQRHLDTLNEEELRQFEALLAFPDGELYGWLFEGAPVPEGVSKTLVDMINDDIKTT